jgi:hypothetical protein
LERNQKTLAQLSPRAEVGFGFSVNKASHFISFNKRMPDELRQARATAEIAFCPLSFGGKLQNIA